MAIPAERQGFLVRLYAAMLDVLIAAVAVLVFTFILGMSFGPRAGAISGALAALAYTLIEGLGGASPGKMFLHVRVGDVDGGELERAVLLKRWAMKYSPCAIHALAALTTWALLDWVGLLSGLAVVMSCFHALRPGRQALHDIVSRAAVYSTEPVEILAMGQRPHPVPQPRAEVADERSAA